jgi:hypothetical protein
VVAGSKQNIPAALERLEEIFRWAAGQEPLVFLDYGGTPTPIVPRPKDAVLAPKMRQTLKKLAQHCFVAVISGRDLEGVQNLVGDFSTRSRAGRNSFLHWYSWRSSWGPAMSNPWLPAFALESP